MEVGRNSDSLTLSGLSSAVAEDDYEGRGTATSLAPFLARLSRDERLGWTNSKSRADDTESLNVNVSDCGSCNLSEVSSVSSWLNDALAIDDDYSSCAPDDDTGSEKDDIDEDDNSPEIRPLFLLQRCLEEKLLERQANADLQCPNLSDCAVSTKPSSSQYDKAELETSTVKRASRNLFTFKSSETAEYSVPIEGQSISDANGATINLSKPLPRSGSRCNPDSLICTGAIYDFNSSSGKGNNKFVNSEIVNGDAVEDRHMHQPLSGTHAVRSLPSEAQSVKNTSVVKDDNTASCVSAVSKHNVMDKFTVHSKPACQDSEQNKSPGAASGDAQQSHVANGSVCHKEINHSPRLSYQSNDTDDTSLKANHGSCESTSSVFFRHSSCASGKSDHQVTLPTVGSSEKSAGEDTTTKSLDEANAENVDTASVVSDEAEKASNHAHSLAMPIVEDGLSNSDISDVDEAFSMFAGLKLPDPVPVDTRSPTNEANSKTMKDDSVTADVHSFLNM